MRSVLLLCCLLTGVLHAQYSPSADDLQARVLTAFRSGTPTGYDALLATAADHALVVKAMEQKIPTDFLDSLLNKPYPGRTRFRAACAALRTLGEQEGIVWEELDELNTYEEGGLLAEAPDGSERMLYAMEYRFEFRQGYRWFALCVGLVIHNGKVWRIGNDQLWLEEEIPDIDGSDPNAEGHWRRLEPVEVKP